MKASIILLLAIFALASCQKEAKVLPKTTPVTPITTTTTTVATIDTIPDNAVFKLMLVKDNANYDETMVVFNKTAKAAYDVMEDAPYFAGMGAESLSSISGDGHDLAINHLPFTPGMTIGVDMDVKSDGPYSLKLSFQKNIPANIQVWVRDTYLKDSVNVSTTNYNFSVAKADANSFGNKRFKLVIKDVTQLQTAVQH